MAFAGEKVIMKKYTMAKTWLNLLSLGGKNM